MIRGGYILQPRKLDESDVCKMPPVTRELWLYILRKVNHKDNGKFRRGQGFFNLNDVQRDLEWYVGFRVERYSKPQLTKSLRRLREGNMIETSKATRGVIVTVCKYDTYQDATNYEGNSENTMTKQRRKSSGHTKNKNDKNDKNDNKEIYSFDDFWNDYDKKSSGKVKSKQKWDKLSSEEKQKIKEHLPKYIQHTPDKTFRKNAETYLHQKHWESEIEEKKVLKSNPLQSSWNQQMK